MEKDKLASHESNDLKILSYIHPVGCQTHPFLPTAQNVNLNRLIFFIMMIFSFHHYTRAQDYDSITTCLRQYEYQKAIDQIDEMVIHASDHELLSIKATALKGLNKYQEAIQVYEKLLKNDTTDVKNIIELASCYQSLGDYKNAQKCYKKALVIRPQNHYLFQQLADAYYQDDDFTHAIGNYFIVYNVDSTYYTSKQLAKCFDNLEKTDTAIHYYHKALNLNPFDFQTAYRLANLYKQNEDFMKAIDITESFLSYDSTNVRMLKLNGLLHLLNKTYVEAIRSFENCISLNDSSDFTNKYLGYSYFKAEEYEKAKDYLEKAFQHDTLNVELCYALGLSCDYSIYKKLGIQYLSKTIELATPSPEFLSRVYQDLAAANTGFYKYEEALAAYLKAYELNSNDTLLIFKIASHYDNWIKDKNKALQYFQIFLETRPEGERPLPKMPVPGEMVISYYDYVERRIGEIKEELFWEGEKHDTPSTEQKGNDDQ